LATDAQLSEIRLKSNLGLPTLEPLTKFTDVLTWAQKEPQVRLMLDIKAVDPRDLVLLLRDFGLESRALILTFDRKKADAALSIRHTAILSVLVKKEADIRAYIVKADGHRLAFYVPQTAAVALFEAARQTGFPVVTDGVVKALGGPIDDRAKLKGVKAYHDYLIDRPVDYFVTNHALRARAALCPSTPAR
jgi:hypothetical protein